LVELCENCAWVDNILREDAFSVANELTTELSMKRLYTVSALMLVVGVGLGTTLSAVAQPGAARQPDSARLVQRLIDGLGLEKDVAVDVANTFSDAHEQGEALRASAKTEVMALRDAVDADDQEAMIAAMQNLETIKADADALKLETKENIWSMLNTRQQAQLTLHHIHKQHRKNQALRHMQLGLE